MDFQVRITEAALADFEEILAYTWANYPETAERFGTALLNHVNLLRTFPYIGSPVGDRPELRVMVHTPFLVYYRVRLAPNVVEVLNFRHGGRGSRPPGRR